MRRVLTSLFLAGAVALAIPQAMYAQRGGHAGGGGHMGGFSGGGGARGFGGGFRGSFSGPRSGSFSGFAPRSFPAPRMSFSPGMGSGLSGRPYGAYPQRNWPVARSSFGQLSAPQLRRGPHLGVPGGGTWGGQPWHGGHNDWHRPPYHSHHQFTYSIFTAPFLYSWPWFGAWPYFGNWDSFGYDPPSDTSAGYDQSYPAQQEPAPAEEEQPEARPAYQPDVAPAYVPGPEPALTIVYKDGHSQQIHNYALTRTTLLLLDDASAGRTQQVSLQEINLPATEQANRAAGVDFRVPVTN